MKETVYSEWFEKPKIGTFFTQAVVDDFMNCLPPACMRDDCSQMGEPYSHIERRDGSFKAKYLTFKRVENGNWQFCGYCFRGENKPPECSKKGEV